MNISQITGIYFSPTGTTKSVTEWITGQIAADKQKTDEVDLTDAILSRPDYTFTEHELAVVGVPVYGGRVPETATRSSMIFPREIVDAMDAPPTPVW